MTYDKENIMNSELAYRVTRHIFQAGSEGDYTKSISEELDTANTTVSHVIRQLREKEVVKKGKRTQAQYYVASEELMISIIDERWREIGEEFNKNLSNLQEVSNLPFEELREVFQRKLDNLNQDFLNEETKELLGQYIRFYFEHNTTSTISKMVEIDLLDSAFYNLAVYRDELPREVREDVSFLRYIYSRTASRGDLAYHKAFQDFKGA